MYCSRLLVSFVLVAWAQAQYQSRLSGTPALHTKSRDLFVDAGRTHEEHKATHSDPSSRPRVGEDQMVDCTAAYSPLCQSSGAKSLQPNKPSLSSSSSHQRSAGTSVKPELAQVSLSKFNPLYFPDSNAPTSPVLTAALKRSYSRSNKNRKASIIAILRNVNRSFISGLHSHTRVTDVNDARNQNKNRPSPSNRTDTVSTVSPPGDAVSPLTSSPLTGSPSTALPSQPQGGRVTVPHSSSSADQTFTGLNKGDEEAEAESLPGDSSGLVTGEDGVGMPADKRSGRCSIPDVLVGDDELPWTCRQRYVWRYLGEHVYPSRLYEAVCEGRTCWYGHFNCTPVTYTLHVLQVCLHNCYDQRVPFAIRSRWQWTDLNVTVGCQCVR